MTEFAILDRLMSSRRPPAAVARSRVSLIRLALPELTPRKLVPAVRLQLLPFFPAGHFAFVCRREESGQLAVWAWKIDATDGAELSRSWPEPLLEAPGAGLRLLERAQGFEAQCWNAGSLQFSQWLERPPTEDEWARFVRACGADPDAHVRPSVFARPERTSEPKGWLRGDNLPAPDPWRGWHWQAAALLGAMLICAALGVHLQLRSQLALDQQELTVLRKQREASLQARSAFEKARAELDEMQALAPQLSQLDLLERILSSGVLSVTGSLPAPTTGSPATPLPGTMVSQGPGALTPTAPSAVMSGWDFRNAQLKLTLEIPDGDIQMLDITRRIEAVTGLSGLKVGQESAANSVVLSMRVDGLPASDNAPARSIN